MLIPDGAAQITREVELMERIGLIGLGTIGGFYVKRLLESGYPVVALDIVPEKVKAAVEIGAQAGESPGDVATRSDVIILAVPDSPAVERVMAGENGILNHLRADHLIIDTGTVRPATDIFYAARCAEKGAALIDSPLTWRRPGQVLMIGGAPEHVERARPILECLSYKMKHVGAVGNGQRLKLVNQALQAGRLAVTAECIELAKQHGFGPELLKDYLEFDIPDVLFGDDFVMAGQLGLHYKDLLYLLEVAHESGAHIPLLSLIHEVFKRAWFAGDKRWAQPGIITYWREMNDIPQEGS
jgi:2-hydroxy-3-oxopropionate reductase